MDEQRALNELNQILRDDLGEPPTSLEECKTAGIDLSEPDDQYHRRDLDWDLARDLARAK